MPVRVLADSVLAEAEKASPKTDNTWLLVDDYEVSFDVGRGRRFQGECAWKVSAKFDAVVLFMSCNVASNKAKVRVFTEASVIQFFKHHEMLITVAPSPQIAACALLCNMMVFSM